MSILRGLRMVLLAGPIVGIVVAGAGVSPAVGATPGVAWSLLAVAQPTSFQSADHNDGYTLLLTNIGGRSSSGTITVTDTLPEGITTSETPRSEGVWSCTEGAGQSKVTCTLSEPVQALTAAGTIAMPVTVTAGASGTLVNQVQVSGGVAECGEAGQPACPTALSSTPTPIAAGTLPFGMLGGTFGSSLLDAAGAVDTQAGDHPGAQSTAFVFPSANQSRPIEGIVRYAVQDARQIVVDLPAGVIGDALAAPTCSLANVTDLAFDPTACPASTRVGTITLLEASTAEGQQSIYNVTPEHGYPAEFAVYVPQVERAQMLYASIRPGPEYGVRLTSGPLSQFVHIVGISSVVFGNPAVLDGSPLSPLAFFTNPSDCQASGFTTSIHLDSWQHTGRRLANGEPDLSDPNWKSASTQGPPVTGCEKLQFHPSIGVAPDTTQADSPTGLNVDVAVPQNEDPNGLATPPLKKATVTLPPGMVVSPGAADGLVACTDAQFDVGSTQPASCPLGSQVATVTARTPVLSDPLVGQVFVGSPNCSPCGEADAQAGRLLRLFLQVQVPGVSLKFPGTVSVDPATGRLTSIFDGLVQQPVSDIMLHFKGGPRAPLANPQVCGQATTTSDLVPWSTPFTANGTPPSSFSVDWDGNGGACPAGLPFAPGFNAGTVIPSAGGYSPFTLTFSRHDREQNLSGLTVTLPPGLLGKLAGIPLCGEPQAALGTCSGASQIGTVKAAAGAGSHPFWTEGRVYLTGPYGGGPFGLSVVVPAVAGPFNLGDVVVRSSIHVDPHTAQITVASDPFPQMIDGVPLRLQTVNVSVDRPGFIFNPTNCTQMQLTATIAAAQGASSQVSSPFAAAGCKNLPFHPIFSVSTQAKTSKASGASLDVKVSSGAGQANIGKTVVTLPKQLPARLTTIQQACPEATFAQNPATCPAASAIGIGSVSTPILANPATGPAYLVSHGGAAFPDVVVILQGEGVTVDLVGAVNIKKGITTASFNTTPDVPIARFELKMPEGPHSGLAANLPPKARGSMCGLNLVMPTTLTGQNGAVIKQSTKIAATGCPPQAKRKSKAKHGKAKKRGR